MSNRPSRYVSRDSMSIAQGWTIDRLTPPSRLFGANGIRAGHDGRIYVAQVGGSQVSAVDPDDGTVETISPMGGGIVSPDDLAIDDDGTIYCTEFTEGRISMLRPDGTTKVVAGDLPAANPITLYQGRLIAGECRPGGRIMELDRNGGAPRIIADNLPLPNAFEVGPDGKLYFPLVGAEEIWRVDLTGGEPEVVARGLARPDSAKFDARGRIVSTQMGNGQVLRIDPRSGAKELIAQLPPGLDNCTFLGERLFVSHLDGSIFEVTSGGAVRGVLPQGLIWPLGLAHGPDGSLLVVDGLMTYLLRPGGNLEVIGSFAIPGYPGFVRGAAADTSGAWFVTTGMGHVARWWPGDEAAEVLSAGHDALMGCAASPDGGCVVAESGAGRVLLVGSGETIELARGLDRPVDVALGGDGAVFVSEARAGRVSRLVAGKTETLIDGLARPEGLTVSGGRIFVLDVERKELVSSDLSGGDRRTLAEHLPVGSPPGVPLQFFGELGALPGPILRFAGLAAGPDGTIFISADAEGSVLALRPEDSRD